MAIVFRNAVETAFPAATSWSVQIPNTAQVGDYLVFALASPMVGTVWASPGWTLLDAFVTPTVPLSTAFFGKFLAPSDDVTGTVLPRFSVNPLPAAGVALSAAYGGVSRAQPIRSRGVQQPLSASTTAVSSAPVSAVAANAADQELSWLITSGAASAVVLPGPSFQLRASTVNGVGIVIALADQIVSVNGLQTGKAWTGGSLPAPVLTEAITLWPDSSNLGQTIELFATLDREPARFDYEYSQEPTVICNTAGYLFKIYAGPRTAPPTILSSTILSAATLLLTRPDGSTVQQALTPSPDGRYGYCVSLNTWFPYTGRYYLQLQLTWGNGSTQFSSQMYLTARPQGGQ